MSTCNMVDVNMVDVNMVEDMNVVEDMEEDIQRMHTEERQAYIGITNTSTT